MLQYRKPQLSFSSSTLGIFPLLFLNIAKEIGSQQHDEVSAEKNRYTQHHVSACSNEHMVTSLLRYFAFLYYIIKLQVEM